MKHKKHKKGGVFGKLFALIGFIVIAMAVAKKLKAFLEVADYLWGDEVEGGYGPVSFKEQEEKKEKEKKSKKVAPEPSEQLSSFKLTPRQEQIYQLISTDGEVSMPTVSSSISDVSPRTLRRDMTKLENLGLVKRVGKTKDSVYKIKE